MKHARFLTALVCATLTLVNAQNNGPNRGLAQILSFETQHPGNKPGGWQVYPDATIFVDDKIVHGGRWSARIERKADSAGEFSVLAKIVDIDFSGKSIEMRGFLRTEDVSGYACLLMREDGDTPPPLAFNNMPDRQLKGTNDWAEYSIALPVHSDAKRLYFAVLLSGAGKAWADDLQLLVDGKPVWEAPKVKTALDADHEFDGGSRMVLKDLTKVQIENLTTLGKVWGFLKYHHPAIASGQRHFDYDLLSAMPAILAARDRPAANAALLEWIDGLGAVATCQSCARLEENELHLRPRLDWISDEVLLGTNLSHKLRSIYTNRRAGGRQFYVGLGPGAGNPVFDHELPYQGVPLPDAGFQLLALYRFWNIIEYWFPYRDVLGEDWDKVLAEFIPRIALAKDSEGYQRELMALIGRAHDTHANLWSSVQVRPPTGACLLPVNVRFIENRAVVTQQLESAGKVAELQPGDVITMLDGVTVAKLVEYWTPYYAASNEPTRLRDMARAMTRGDCAESGVGVLRDGKEFELKIARVPASSLDGSRGSTHDLAGETFRLLSKDVGYLKLSSVTLAGVHGYVDGLAGTKGLIIDIRNYPSAFVVFALGSLLVSQRTDFVRFTTGDLSNPGAFHWGKPLSLTPAQPHYSGKVVILVDEVTQSQAEYTTMALRVAPGAMVIGSTTAGADGNVSAIPLPGGLRSMISGIGVFYPDKKPTQRIGILPDVEKRPTIAGVRDGRDELLEEAVRRIVGSEVSSEEIRKMTKP